MNVGGCFYSCFKTEIAQTWVAAGRLLPCITSLRRLFAGMLAFQECMDWAGFSLNGKGQIPRLSMISKFVFHRVKKLLWLSKRSRLVCTDHNRLPIATMTLANFPDACVPVQVTTFLLSDPGPCALYNSSLHIT
jgi:hypothetical protein